MNVAILGLGEVGSAIKKLVSKKHKAFVRELNFDEVKGQQIDIVHICIPYNKKFDSIVIKFLKETKPKFAVISSTIKPGTTEKIFIKTDVPIAHAPISGVHPNLYDYLFVFTKPIGAVDDKSYRLVNKHFKELGVKTVRFDSPLETEMAKIMCTTYYGWNIIFEKWVHESCKKQGANYDQVYTKWNKFYNEGYKESLPNVIRPVMKHMDGPIGGHCVIPNANIIYTWMKDTFTKFLLQQDKHFGKLK